ncbi:SAM-dependent methyltransferase [Halobacteriales archaeon QS_8_69_26]|nr:MAG: SAM-dependent methyltransferase [Halobacteriales archaeon QS_8_69_26]
MGILEDKARARLFYRYLSKVYDRINPFVWTEEMRTEAIDMLEIDEDDRVLDVGCGTGFATQGLLEHVDVVHGLDQSVHQLRRAWAKFGKHGPVRFYLGDAERLPFADDSFDVVWSSGSIEYWPDPVATLREFRRVAKPGGQVLVVGPNRPTTPIKRRLADSIMLFYGEDRAQEMFEAAGFTDVRHRLMGPAHSPTIAITTVARVPEGDDPVDAGTAEGTGAEAD